MSSAQTFNSLVHALRDFIHNPLIIIPSLTAFGLLTLLSYSIQPALPLLKTNTANILWVIGYSFVALVFLSICFTFLIAFAAQIVRKQHISFYQLTLQTKKSCLRNFIITFIILLTTDILIGVSTLIGRLFVALNPQLAILIFIITMFAGSAGIIIFFTFAGFITIIKQQSILKSIKQSRLFVKINYLDVLILLVFFFAVNWITEHYIPPVYNELVQSIFIVPLLALTLVRFFLTNHDIPSKR